MLPKLPGSLPISKLNPSELQAPQDRSSCDNSDDRYLPEDKCKDQYFVLFQQEEDLHLHMVQDLKSDINEEDIP